MELVYLWVKNYKNIHKQGFNFSGRYRCHYDPDQNKLTIDKNKDYIHIFPENIHVTAIVGENGAGKSSLFEILLSEYENQSASILIIVDTAYGIRYVSNHIYLKEYEKFDENFKNKIIYFSNSLSSFTNKSNISESIENHVPKRFEQDLAKLYKELFKDDYFSIYETEQGLFTLNLKEILSDNPNTFQKIDKRVSFNKFKYLLDFSLLSKNIKDDDFYSKAIETSKENSTSNLLKFIIISRWKSSFIYNKKVDFIIKQNRALFKKENFSLDDYSKINAQLNTLTVLTEYNDKNVNELISKLQYKENEIWISNNFYSINYEETNPLLSSWRFFFYSRVNFYKENNEELDYLSLSSGEREYIKLLTTFIYTLNKSDKAVYFLDEVDLSLHPNWQKRLLNDLMYFIEMFGIREKIQLIFSTHSPFLLSDIPKDNVVFLKDGKQDKTVNIDTFGANIHTLLSHGFFMEEGLMGEFAKQKINEVVKLLKSKRKLTQKNFLQCKNIISIIGEPILQKTLQNMLNEKKLSYLSKLEKLKIQRKEIEDQIKALEEYR